jgi:hypothetical protein
MSLSYRQERYEFSSLQLNRHIFDGGEAAEAASDLA